MNQRQYLVKGTFLLTFAGLFTRIAGFFYKIFLSRTIGAKEIGLYQLTLPIFSLCMSLSCGGIQTSVSRFTAEYQARNDSFSSRRILACALLVAVPLAGICTFLVSFGASWIASACLLEPSCKILLQIIAWSLPFAVIHACISGYFIGIKKITVSAVSQLLEQLLRIGTSILFCCLLKKSGRSMDARVMALGQIAGEVSSALYCMYCLCSASKNPAFENTPASDGIPVCSYSDGFHKILSVSLPLSINRLFTCVLQSFEAALLPQMLQQFGLSSSRALSSYGTLTGMALPLILFPTALTGAFSTLLLPAVSEASALHQKSKIKAAVRTGTVSSLFLGFVCLVIFFLSGSLAGNLLFKNSEAGRYIRILAFVCPFLYLNTALISVLHGIGKTPSVFFWNLAGFCIRLCSVICAVPRFGMNGYLFGTIASQMFLSCCTCFSLRRYLMSCPTNG